MDTVDNQAFLTAHEVRETRLSSPYAISGACINEFRKAEGYYHELQASFVGEPNNSRRAEAREELSRAMLKMNLFRRMTEHYLRSPLD